MARSPIAPAPPVIVLAGWEVSGRRANAATAGGTRLTITDWTPLAKVQAAGPGRRPGGRGDRRAIRPGGAGQAGTLVVGSGPGEWLLLAGPGQAPELESGLAAIAAQASAEHLSWSWISPMAGR